VQKNIPPYRHWVFPSIAIVMGLCVGLLAGELFFRFKDDSKHFSPKQGMWHDHDLMHCYPTNPFGNLPIDLHREPDRQAFQRRFPEANIPELQEHTPYCVAYYTADDSPRRRTVVDHPTDKIAIIGDSFAFGEGVADDAQTYGAQLARMRHATVQLFAWPGADIGRVRRQFDVVLQAQPAAHFTKIIYLFVLNDPVISSDLRIRQYYLNLNDLIGIRLGELNPTQDLHGFSKYLWQAGRCSKLAAAIARRLVIRRVTQDTIGWYQAIFDERQNPGIIETFEIVREMKMLSESHGMHFYLAIYPLMIDLKHYPFREAHETVKRLGSMRGVDVIDLLPAFERNADKRLTVHPLDSHPNGAADKIAAEATAQSLPQ